MRVLFGLIGLLGFPLWAQQAPTTETPPPKEVSPIRSLGGDYHNSIKLLQNRFRIDYQVDEITMVFFREYGSAPVVLVRPDGSKIFQKDANGVDLFWYDASTYDMISIKNPVPGPWQAVGQVLPGSRVMVISDIQLHADPLPDIIFSGEILKQTAYLTNGGEPIDYTEFRDVVSLDIRLISTNNPNFNNFGADAQTIATFEDNGRGMDEKPMDGVFTGQFNLAVPDGEWTPVFVVTTPMFTREQVDPNLMLYPNPINISVQLDSGNEGYHKILIDAEREFVDMETLLIDGKIRFPNGDVQNFSLTESSPNTREHQIINYEYGVYRVKLTAYGNTTSGRDFILDVPEYTFLVDAPEPELPPAAEGAADQATGANGEQSGVDAVVTAEPQNMAGEDPLAQAMLEQQSEQEQGLGGAALAGWIIGINVFLVLVGGGAIWWLLRPKRPAMPTSEPGTQQQPQQGADKPALMDRLRALWPFGKKPSPEQAPAEKENSKGGSKLNLSLPEDD
ncbi:TIGR03503 family protein [Aestuariibacter halophilus]|uniref:TIGR03503 family protein n=1 Tax=Fluctibacter halophilus TaxID=226011 RepID=A0ABS8G4L9_9ALTE|nr:TIGR03503 family protein [Aestuariibacter halophilus]MCC2615532.1 TIGR03503 family protein [Aestuariibacter halophilus]